MIVKWNMERSDLQISLRSYFSRPPTLRLQPAYLGDCSALYKFQIDRDKRESQKSRGKGNKKFNLCEGTLSLKIC